MDKVLFVWRYLKHLYIYECDKEDYKRITTPGYTGGAATLRFRKFDALEQAYPNTPGEIISDGEAVFLVMKYEMEKIHG